MHGDINLHVDKTCTPAKMVIRTKLYEAHKWAYLSRVDLMNETVW